MAKANRGFVLSYQANSHLYERFDVKKKIATALVKGGAKQLQSYTDSTIYFELNVEERSATSDCKKMLITKLKEEKITTLQYTIATLWFNTDRKPTFDNTNGDKDLDKRFEEIVKTIRTELGISK